MTARIFSNFRRARSAILALKARARRLGRGEAGVAAVEFALLLPMMLALYFGCVVLAQGLEVGRKTQALSRTLADLTSQTLPGSSTASACASYKNVPCLADSDLQNIFNAATAVLFPFSGTTNMTISEIVFDNVSSTNSACCRARVVWSVGYGVGPSPSPTARACGLLNQSANGLNGPTLMPTGVYPGGNGDAVTSPPPFVASGNTTDNYVIVADVTYSYSPGFGFQSNNWSQSPNNGAGYKITQTTYMSPRNGATTTTTATSSPQPPNQPTAIVWNTSNSFAQANICTQATPGAAAAATGYNLP
jgi:Flp pilus assembly protein TadG